MKRELIYGEPVEMDEEESAWFTAMEEQADRDAEREIREGRPAPKWSKDQFQLITQAAIIYGIPFETYLRQAVVRQAIADLRAAREADPRLETFQAFSEVVPPRKSSEA